MLFYIYHELIIFFMSFYIYHELNMFFYITLYLLANITASFTQHIIIIFYRLVYLLVHLLAIYLFICFFWVNSVFIGLFAID